MIRIPLTPEQATALRREINMPRRDWGGFQHLISRLQEGLKRNGAGWELALTCDDGRRVLEYSKPSYGAGTYQSQLRPIAPDVERALAEAGAFVETAPLF